MARSLFSFALLLCALVSLCAMANAHGSSLAGETFVLDAGHGTHHADGTPLNVGAVGPDGIEEADVTLAVAEDLRALVERSGGKVVLTRSYAKRYRVAYDIPHDNHARAALANRIGATAFIAIHADASTSPESHGTSVFWLRPNSVALANAMRAELATLGLGESEFRPRHLAVTDEARVPAVLVELGFVSNRTQERLLATPSFQAREARALARAIAETFGR
jgi:N-acetylmuramoyl-L-alanine amidase